MATARKIRDAEEARRCLDEVADSQLERAEWARKNGVNARSLNAGCARGALDRAADTRGGLA